MRMLRQLQKIVFVICIFSLLIFQLVGQRGYAADTTAGEKSSNENQVLLTAMQEELQRSMQTLGKKGNPPAYFISYRITDTDTLYISASYGSLSNNIENRSRILDVDVRVGSHELDNTHAIRGRFDFDYSRSPAISIEDDPAAIKTALWLETDKKYKAAVKRLIQVETNKSVSVKEEDESDDFSREKPQTYTGEKTNIFPDKTTWEKRMKEYSAIFNDYPEIYISWVVLRCDAENKSLVTSENTVLQQGRKHWRISILAGTKAEDGMELYKSRIFDAHTAAKLPGHETVKSAISDLAKELIKLREAPLMEPYTGPAILSGSAAAVFFHEIFGHRIEGHRQKDETEGQTFAKKIGQPILPSFISVYDDPNLEQYDGIDLNGHYLYDDEGVKAQRVNIVEKGILKNFLMSRSPIKNFPNSNGHGRAQAGRQPVSRQGNLIIESSKQVSAKELRARLIAECKAQGKPYGLYFEVVSGGSTFTGRVRAQSFNVTPITVYRVYVDGRPDELVRGVDLIGTPLTSFSKIIACGRDAGIFNGYCGAESGQVPVSAICPPVLTAQIEVQKKHKATDKPPVLPPPPRAQQAQENIETGDDVILRAMKDELQRSMKALKIEGMEPPYYLEYTLLDEQALDITANFGALVDSRQRHARLLKVELRVGDYRLDNTGFIGSSQFYSFVPGYSRGIVLEDDYHAIRHDIWLETDKVYKEALEQLAAKQAFLKNNVQTEPLPDFSKEESIRYMAPLSPVPPLSKQPAPVRTAENSQKDEPASIIPGVQTWEETCRDLSAMFRNYPGIHDSGVVVQIKSAVKYYVNSEGTEVRQPQPFAGIFIHAGAQAKDGMEIKNYVPFYALEPSGLPQKKELTAAVQQMAQEITALAACPMEEDYIGPVLFTEAAAAELFAQVLAPHLSGERPPLTEEQQVAEMLFSSGLARRIDRRVLPRQLTIVSDPLRSSFGKQSLIGSYPVDDQGVKARPVELVHDGMLRTLLMSRRPRKEITHSNGHARIGPSGSVGVQPSNLIITAEKGTPYKKLKKKLLKLCKEQRMPYGLLVKTLDNPPITGTETSAASLMGMARGGVQVSSPILIYRVYARDGHEELVRGVSFGTIDLRDLKDTYAIGNDYYVHHCLMGESGMGRFSNYSYGGAGSTEGVPVSIVAPSLLFEELEFTKQSGTRQHPPLLPHPYFDKK